MRTVPTDLVDPLRRGEKGHTRSRREGDLKGGIDDWRFDLLFL